MKKQILAIIFFVSLFSCQAQIPTFQWAAGFGGGGTNIGVSIVTDAAGNVYTAGSFSGTVDFDPGFGTYTLSSMGSSDVFISKLSSSGAFVWAKKFSISTNGFAYSIALDAAGNVYTTGYFNGTTDFDPGPGTYNLVSAGAQDIFVSKLNNSGAFVWAKQLGGPDSEMGQSIVVDANGNVCITGYFQGAGDYDPGAGTYILTPIGPPNGDIFISKLDASGFFVWAKQFTSDAGAVGYAIKVDPAGNVFTTGYFTGYGDFDPGPGTYTLNSFGGTDIFVSKLDPSGTFVWAKQMGGPYSDFGFSLDLDNSGNVYTTGVFQLTTDFDPGIGTFTLTSAGMYDVFISKLDATGAFVWAKQFGGTNDDFGQAIKIDAVGNVHTTGYFNGTVDFDPGPGTYPLTSAGASDIFISKLDTAGTFVWALEYGGIDSDVANSITADVAGNVCSTGYFAATADFDSGPAAYTLVSAGISSAFVQKLCVVPSSPTNVTLINNQNLCVGQSATLSAISSGTINWFATPSGTTVLGTGTNYITPTLTAGNYTYYAEASGCFANPLRTPIGITVTALPLLSASTNVALLCVGLSATLTVLGVTNATWNPGGTGTIIVVSPTITTTYTVIGSNGSGCSKVSYVGQPVSACNSIQQLTNTNSGLEIYPNPVSNELNIKNNFNSEVELYLYDNTGKRILYKRCERDETVLTINTSQYPLGIYYLRLSSSGEYYHSKVMILKN